MGKSTKPLTIYYVVGMESDPPWVEELRTKGHVLLPLVLPSHVDLILGPVCARFLPGMEKFLESFIRGARAVRYKDDKMKPLKSLAKALGADFVVTDFPEKKDD